MKTEYTGIDYGLGQTNKDKVAGIRYGVISQNEVLQAWADSSEPDYGTPSEPLECPECGKSIPCPANWGDTVECEFPDFAEPLGFILDDGEYKASCGESGDIFIMKSPYFTYAQFCSPCAPGACYLANPLSEPNDNNKAYCFGLDMFENEKAPYNIYSVETGELLVKATPQE